VLCLSLLCPALSGRAGTQLKDSPLLALLPDGPELRGWAKDGDPQFFEGKDLFIYIDGGAEIYFEYGFRRVIVQDYRNDAGSRLSIEIFEMESTDSAYGMFTFKRSPRGEAVALGDECQLADYYLNLCKGRYLVTITSLDQEAAAKEGLAGLARLVEKKLSERGQSPGLISLLPEGDQQPQSIRFFKGPLALYNSYPFFREDVLAFQSGIKGEYANGCSLFLFEYGAHEAADRRFIEARRKASAEPKYRNIEWDGELLKAQDERGRTILAKVSGRYIVLVLAGSPPETAERLLARAEKRLAAKKEEP
jgi:hypothetical protein